MMLIISMYGYVHLSILCQLLCPDVHLGLGPIVALWAPNGQYDVWGVYDAMEVWRECFACVCMYSDGCACVWM